VEQQGLFGAPPIDVFVNGEAHRTIFTALRLLGLGDARLRRVETDDAGRMQPAALAAALGSRHGPCLICAQAGNVNTGACDPLEALADVAAGRSAWLHVDGAFGAWAAASPSRRHLVAGLARIDSLATDGHKWLNVPYDCGIALTAHPEAHQAALTMPAHYIQMTPGVREPRAFTPDESRRARAIPLYAALATLGRDGVRDLVDRCCALAGRMAAALAPHPRVAVLNEVVLNQVLVRFRAEPGRDADGDDEVTRAVITRVQEDGTCWAGGTVWRGRTAMRISVSNWSSTEADIDRSATAILAALDRR
jgi:glutamate/tyrosine decarboxylase-like PLP-dependent enzyme